MHLFDAEDKLKKYDKVEEIIDDYYETRLKLYQTRKEYMVKALEKELVVLSNKAKYIMEVLEGSVDLRKKKGDEVTKMLKEKNYALIDNEFKYLTKMPMDSVTEENVDKLNKEHENKMAELESVKNTTICQMWLNELEVFKEEYLEYKETRERLMNGSDEHEQKGSSKNKKKVISKGPLKSKTPIVIV
jgi:DNA topoisomerase-2